MTVRCARCGSVEVLLPEDPRPSPTCPTCPDCGAPRAPEPSPIAGFARAAFGADLADAAARILTGTTDDECDELREAFREDDRAANDRAEWRRW